MTLRRSKSYKDGPACRQRSGVHQPAFSGVVRGAADRVDPHSAGEADAECAGGKFSRTAARRMFERELVSELIRCEAEDCSLADGIQRAMSAQQSGVSDAERICGANSELWKRRR